MSKESVESRRAFFKKAGKFAGLAALAAPFLAASSNVEATDASKSPNEPPSSCRSCSGGCYGACLGTCRGGCDGGCNDKCAFGGAS